MGQGRAGAVIPEWGKVLTSPRPCGSVPPQCHPTRELVIHAASLFGDLQSFMRQELDQAMATTKPPSTLTQASTIPASLWQFLSPSFVLLILRSGPQACHASSEHRGFSPCRGSIGSGLRVQSFSDIPGERVGSVTALPEPAAHIPAQEVLNK